MLSISLSRITSSLSSSLLLMLLLLLGTVVSSSSGWLLPPTTTARGGATAPTAALRRTGVRRQRRRRRRQQLNADVGERASYSSELDDRGTRRRRVVVTSAARREREQREDATEGKKQAQQEQYLLRFGGVGRLYANAAAVITTDQQQDMKQQDQVDAILKRLRRSTVIVFGLGGVGSWSAEALCRSGVGNIALVDLDDICISNTNRQIHATSTSVGQMKIDEMKRRLRDINPDCNVTLVHDFVDDKNAYSILESLLLPFSSHLVVNDEDSDLRRRELATLSPLCPTAPAAAAVFVLDAIDGSKDKSALLAACSDLRIPVVTCGGAAGRSDPTRIVTADLTNVKGDKLLSTCRKDLRKHYGFPPGLSFQERRRQGYNKVKPWNIDCVYSLEDPKDPATASGGGGDNNINNNVGSKSLSSFRMCDGALGTACFVTGTYGFVAASRIVDRIASNRLDPPNRHRRRRRRR